MNGVHDEEGSVSGASLFIHRIQGIFSLSSYNSTTLRMCVKPVIKWSTISESVSCTTEIVKVSIHVVKVMGLESVFFQIAYLQVFFHTSNCFNDSYFSLPHFPHPMFITVRLYLRSCLVSNMKSSGTGSWKPNVIEVHLFRLFTPTHSQLALWFKLQHTNIDS